MLIFLRNSFKVSIWKRSVIINFPLHDCFVRWVDERLHTTRCKPSETFNTTCVKALVARAPIGILSGVGDPWQNPANMNPSRSVSPLTFSVAAFNVNRLYFFHHLVVFCVQCETKTPTSNFSDTTPQTNFTTERERVFSRSDFWPGPGRMTGKFCLPLNCRSVVLCCNFGLIFVALHSDVETNIFASP